MSEDWNLKLRMNARLVFVRSAINDLLTVRSILSQFVYEIGAICLTLF